MYSSREGRLEIGSSIITEAEEKKKFKPFLNLSEILAFSSNVGAGSMGLDIGDKKLRKTLIDFGFGAKTGIDFPGEAKGLLKQLPWRDIETATISFGHGIASTALQVVTAYAAIANGGWLRQPLLVKKVRNPYTGEEKNFKVKNLRRVLTKEQTRTLSLMLVSVTEKGGTGALANVPGYFVAGKTGTAQKVDSKDKGYTKGEYISSFAGFIPAHNPKFVIYLMIDGAKDNFYASSLVAPLFSKIASYVVRQAGLLPTVLSEENIMREDKPNRSLSSTNANNKRSTKTENSYTAKQVVSSSNKDINSSSKQDLFLMPDLEGLSMRQALKELSQQNLNIKIKGVGRLLKSFPEKGKHLNKKDVLLIFS